MKLLSLFFDVEKLQEVNAQYHDRIAEIDANYAEQTRERKFWRKKNSEKFREAIAANTNNRNARLGRVERV
jgi:hypothetical protein